MQSAFFQPPSLFRLAAIAAAGLLLSAYFLEFFIDVIPCPLCIVQRFFYLCIGLTALLAWGGWLRQRLAAALMGLWSFLGLAVAARQVHLQSLPVAGDATRCGVSFGSFLDSVIQALGGLGNCAVVDYTFLWLSLAQWSLLCFAGFLGLSFWLFRRERPVTPPSL